MARESFGSRLGFIMVSAGCAVGIGNVWKFPYMCGEYGGAAFIVIYLVFLAILGFPILVCEYAVGRASRQSVATSFKQLQPEGGRWHNFGYMGMAGNYLLMMFYTMVAGWMVYYFFRSVRGDFTSGVLSTEDVGNMFGAMTQQPGTMTFWMIVATVVSFAVCALGLQNGVEKITKYMMIGLLVMIGILAIHSLMLPGSGEGVKFYLVPSLATIQAKGLGNVVFAAMSQAFFTLSLGIGSMAICGSYKDRSQALTGDAMSVVVLDTFVALMAGMIIIPACFSFGVEPGAGPSLIFITLPNIFNQMAGGRIWASLFFLFLTCAAFSTVVAVFENILSFAMDLWGWTRRKAVMVNAVALIVLSLPCILGFSVLSGIQPLGPGSAIMDLEDFIVSNNLLPLGAIVYLMFCVKKNGWGWDNFLAEANEGKGMHFPALLKSYMTYVLPAIIIIIYIKGYIDKFSGIGMNYFIPWMIIALLFLTALYIIIFTNKKTK